MKKKVLLMTLIGLVLLGAVLAAALNAVFTVTDVKVSFSVISNEGRAESLALQEELEEKFVGRSTTFLDLSEVNAAVGEHPAFRVERVEKDFPRTVVLSVTERRELYAVPLETGKFAILDEEGNYLYDKEENVNRCGGANILLEGFDLHREGSGVTGKYFPEVLSFVGVFSERLGDARANLMTISLEPTPNPIMGDGFFRLLLKEQVTVAVYFPANLTRMKAEKVLEKYLSLSDTQRLYGFFDVYDLENGEFTVSEHRPELPI